MKNLKHSTKIAATVLTTGLVTAAVGATALAADPNMGGGMGVNNSSGGFGGAPAQMQDIGSQNFGGQQFGGQNGGGQTQNNAEMPNFGGQNSNGQAQDNAAAPSFGGQDMQQGEAPSDLPDISENGEAPDDLPELPERNGNENGKQGRGQKQTDELGRPDDKQKDNGEAPGAKILSSIEALEDGDLKDAAQAAYDAFEAAMTAEREALDSGASEDELAELKAATETARAALDKALAAAGIEVEEMPELPDGEGFAPNDGEAPAFDEGQAPDNMEIGRNNDRSGVADFFQNIVDWFKNLFQEWQSEDA